MNELFEEYLKDRHNFLTQSLEKANIDRKQLDETLAAFKKNILAHKEALEEDFGDSNSTVINFKNKIRADLEFLKAQYASRQERSTDLNLKIQIIKTELKQIEKYDQR